MTSTIKKMTAKEIRKAHAREGTSWPEGMENGGEESNKSQMKEKEIERKRERERKKRIIRERGGGKKSSHLVKMVWH